MNARIRRKILRKALSNESEPVARERHSDGAQALHWYSRTEEGFSSYCLEVSRNGRTYVMESSGRDCDGRVSSYQCRRFLRVDRRFRLAWVLRPGGDRNVRADYLLMRERHRHIVSEEIDSRQRDYSAEAMGY